ncbi:hypothetical protein NXV03_20860 [Phocaeicola vulgatus]|nr:hypothetical protein [Phocaeicola vulgatus]
MDRRGSPLHPQRTVRRDISANHLAGRAGGGDPGGASLRGDPAVRVLSSAASIFCGGIPAGISQRIWRIHNNSP